MATFERWFSGVLGKPEREIHRLLNDGRAIRFLITWSMFEGRCFSDSASEEEIHQLAERITEEGFDSGQLAEALAHFHDRYQDKARLRHLMHGRKGPRLAKVLAIPLQELSPAERAFLVLFVVFRFRNNMFHGNKGVGSWLQYDEQIRLCTEAMQPVISHVEQMKQKAAA
jgi:hypothetical protein